jgi:hypothetical protein
MDANDFFLAYWGDDVGGEITGPGPLRSVLPSGGEGVWEHVAATYDGVALVGFLDGVEGPPTPRPGPLEPGSSAVFLGADTVNGGETVGTVDLFTGILDEVRIDSVPRSRDWIDAERASATGELAVIGREER